MFLTLHVHNQQCVADSEGGPEPEGLSCRQEVLIDDEYGGHHSHREGDDHGPAQHGQHTAAGCEQADAYAAVALWAVQFIHSRDVLQQPGGLPGQKPAESSRQKQAQPALRRPLVEKVQTACQGTAERELALH